MNRQRNWVPPTAETEVPTEPIDILRLDNEHSNDLAYALLQFTREVKIAHSFKEDNNTNVSLSETNMVRFRTLGQSPILTL